MLVTMTLHSSVMAPETRRAQLDTLAEVTAIPTAAGHEDRVIAYIEAWVRARTDLRLQTDRAGNLVVSFAKQKATKRPPLFITAHLDHPAFVVERLLPEGRFECSFRGGVMEVFFDHAPITVHTAEGIVPATLSGPASAHSPAGKHYLAEPERVNATVSVGDVGTWMLPGPELETSTGYFHTPACDDLAAAAAALGAMDGLRAARARREKTEDVRLLFTRSEEIGFIGAIAAVKLKTIPKNARVLALENSRSFADSPLGGGPIVRVGDRLSIFTPWLTAACAQRAEEVFGGSSSPTASQTRAQTTRRPWQRKLMSGGACEASVFCHAGFAATCICLPLGNYHNMPHLDQLQAGTYDATETGPPRAAPEFIHVEDYYGLIDLLVGLGLRLPDQASDFGDRLDKLYNERAYVLDRPGAKEPRKTAARRRKPAAKPRAKR